MRRFVIGDIHGAHKAFLQCLEKADFNYSQDLLISVGDICDGWPETRQCIDEFLKITHHIMVLGNHDSWALQWMKSGEILSAWYQQGGRQTVESYGGEIPEEHITFLENAPMYYRSNDNLVFVHAGLIPNLPLSDQDEQTLLWDRDFFYKLRHKIGDDSSETITPYKEVYIGHTPIHRLGYYQPEKAAEVWLMDTGAAWEGTLSMMDIDSKEVYISERPVDLYPKGSGRF